MFLFSPTIDRFYKRFLEEVTLLAKIEELLGLSGSVRPNPEVKQTVALWPEDKKYMPSRYLKDRYDTKRSEQFIDKKMKEGANKVVHCTFLVFQISAVLLLCGGIVLFIINQ